MNSVQSVKSDGGPPLQLFNCAHTDCGATFTRQWRLKEHETVHTGARPCLCTIAGCGRRFSRKSHLRGHMLQHRGVKQFQCKFATCTKSFFNGGKLRRHVRYAHGDKNKYFKCNQPKCSLTFKKRKMYKLHLQKHQVAAKFKCSKDGCTATFDCHIARKAHENKHAGYRCPHDDCQVIEHTWGKLKKHMAKHSATFECQVCKKVFKKADALRRHKRIHASHKPVLVCPRDDCQAYFSTTFNLQHHIRKVHLKLLKYKCSFPECPRTFAMRVSNMSSVTGHWLLGNISVPRNPGRNVWMDTTFPLWRKTCETSLHCACGSPGVPKWKPTSQASSTNERSLIMLTQKSTSATFLVSNGLVL
ncbi:P43 5S RNA-binding protein-like [Scomber scombrus]|uniref:P43 5S RNA-binding protein-like n=1 Tax=Scomber scombrus TaxID=13677 RepID=A0AAV1NNV3_SCOSC